MSSTTYEFTARGKQESSRPRLMSGWTLAGFAVLVLIPMVMIFPKQSLLREASQQRLGDLLTINYLDNLLRAEPNNLELRLLLAEHKTHLGDTDGVAELIRPAIESRDPVWQANGLLAEYKLVLAEMARTDKDSPQYRALLERSTKLFHKLSLKPWKLPTLVYLAGQADRLHERGVSLLLYRAIEDASSSVSVQWLVDTASYALSKFEYELAAHLYFLARHREYSISGQREYLLAGVHALMAGGLYGKAMLEIDLNLDNLENDDETLYSLVQAARAANDQTRAIRYTKRLLRLSKADDFTAPKLRFNLALIGIADAEAGPLPQDGKSDIRPYDFRKYQLAYEVFIANSKLDEAFRVAQAAVLQVPEEAVWHKRLAQLAEWLGKPELALREWQWLLRHGEGRNAILAVLRLAPGVNDYEALLDAWIRMEKLQALNQEQRGTLISLFEQTGRQDEGIRYFEGRYAIDHRVGQLEAAARLAERSSEDDRALALYTRLLKSHDVQSGWVLKIALLYLRKSKFNKAYDLLEHYRGSAGNEDAEYWKLLADLAWQLQLDDEARRSYRRLQAYGKLARDDYSRLVFLIDDSRKEEKAALAESAFRHTGDREMLFLALDIHSARQDIQAQRRLFELVALRDDVDLSASPRFYLLRAQYFQASGDYAAARSDFRRAVGLSPEDPETVNGILWFLIDGNDEVALREMIALLAARGELKNPAYWSALAAAHLATGQPSRAVDFYTLQLKQRQRDFLWLVTYADALEQAGQGGMANRVRRQAWQEMKTRLSGKPMALPFSQDMLAAARLSMMNHPGDPSLALVRSVLRQDRLVAKDAVADRATSELVLGWALSTEQSANAKAWLWQRYARAIQPPLWAEAAVALAETDRERLDGMVTTQADGLSKSVAHDGLQSLGRTDQARAVAFEALEREPDSATAHAHLAEDALATASFIDAGLRNAQIGSLHQLERFMRLDMPFDRETRVAVEYANTLQSDSEDPGFATVSPGETVGGIALRHRGIGGDTEIAVRRRNEFARTTEAVLKHSLEVLPRTSLQLGAEFHAAAFESNQLREFAMRNRIDVALMYAIDRRDYLHVEPGWSRYYMQTGEYLGSGSSLGWELGHRIYTGYPDWKVRLIGAHTRFSMAAFAPMGLPSDSNLYGVCAGVGESRRHDYGYERSWRPYLDYCATRNDVSGNGYNAGLGLAGPVAGADQLSLSYGSEYGGVNFPYGRSHEFKLNYRYYFD